MRKYQKINKFEKKNIYRFLRKKEIKIYQHFLNSLYSRKYYQSQIKFIKWAYIPKFSQRILKKNELSIMGAFDKKNKKLNAIFGFNFGKIYFKKKVLNLATSFQYENKSRVPGAAFFCFKRVSDIFDAILINGLNTKYIQSIKRYFSIKNYTKEINRKIAIINTQTTNKLFNTKKNPKLAKFIKNNEAANTYANYFLTKSIKKISEKYWPEHKKKYYFTTDKSKNFLSRRYQNHPYLNYQFIGSDEKFKNGIAVVRKEQINYLSRKKKKNYCIRILEFLPKKGYEKDLNNSIISYAHKQKVVMCDFFCSYNHVTKKSLLADFINFDKHKNKNIPYRLQPPEVTKEKSYNQIMISKHKKISNYKKNKFYSTKGDGEQDLYFVQSGLSEIL